MNTEKIYDEQISPLMTQIIKICQGNNMPMFAHFPLIDKEGSSLACTTSMPYGTGSDVEKMIKLIKFVKPDPPKLAGIAVMKNDDGTFRAEVTSNEGYSEIELEILRKNAEREAEQEGRVKA